MKRLITIALIGIASAHSYGQILSDNFNNPGTLSGSNPQIGNSWQGVAGSGQLMKSNGTLNLDSDVSQEVQSTFAPISEGSIYAGFTIDVTVSPSTPWKLPISFMGQNFSGGNQVGRIFVSTGSTAELYRIGIENNMDNPVWWPAELQTNSLYRIVLGFTENGTEDVTKLWIDPTNSSDQSISETAEDITGEIYGVRLNGYNGTSGIILIDDLIVDQSFLTAVPEPSVYALVLLSAVIALYTYLRSNKALQSTPSRFALGVGGRSDSSRSQPVIRTPDRGD